MRISTEIRTKFTKRKHNNSSKLWEDISNNSKLINKRITKNMFYKIVVLVKKFNINSVACLCHGKKPSTTTCSPHLTFITNSFFNPPHVDKADVSDYAFIFFIPTFSDTGALSNRDYKNFTLPPSPSSKFTFLGMSLQINFSLANSWCKKQRVDYKNPLQFCGDHFH
ncbi:hypothetical protein VP01_1784g4 [Puccinia sorghi]|uniref:Tet-like 2OG-Fe(II) oxygenase domain-containing protein n=1 Tax=Puccinia sorghi TaxID=27349 RepID=A0A0L6VGG0_9BASI|nr:hypothetical protein VP01_1784g4 [Puccinia sorghi]